MIGDITYTVPHLMYWDWRIAADLFIGGVGVGAFVIAVLNSLYYKDKYPAVSKIGAVLSPILIAVGLLFLLSELGHPMRIWRTVTGFNASSPLSWGALFQTLMIIVGAIYARMWLKPGSSKAARNLVGIMGLPIALIVGANHGWLLAISPARPLWNTGPATITAMIGFATTGMAAILLLLCLKKHKAPSAEEPSAAWMIQDFRALLVGALIVQTLTFLVWYVSLNYGSADAQASLAAANEAYGPLFWFVGIGLGLIVPVLLQLPGIVGKKDPGKTPNVPLTLLTVVLILVGGYVFRYAVVMGGQIL
ncbi:MAG: polysulfide reductase NrfD [Planctomycetes bacterium]|nr:polysulfide reductase NrfD [Planctomycetota bacterium]